MSLKGHARSLWYLGENPNWRHSTLVWQSLTLSAPLIGRRKKCPHGCRWYRWPMTFPLSLTSASCWISPWVFRKSPNDDNARKQGQTGNWSKKKFFCKKSPSIVPFNGSYCTAAVQHIPDMGAVLMCSSSYLFPILYSSYRFCLCILRKNLVLTVYGLLSRSLRWSQAHQKGVSSIFSSLASTASDYFRRFPSPCLS